MTATVPTKNIYNPDDTNGFNDVEEVEEVEEVETAEVETVLRGELNARAVGLPPDGPPVPRIMSAVRRDRMHRKAVIGTGFVLVAALLAAATPAVLGAAHGSGAASAAARGDGPSSLLSMAPRGNLVGDTDFMRAVESRLPGEEVLYANDDGTHVVVVGADVSKQSPVEFRTLVGGHDANVPQLGPATGGGEFNQDAKTYTFVGEPSAGDARVPVVVLGPMDLTGIEYATGLRLTETRGKLVPVRTGVRQIKAVDGVAEMELAESADTKAPDAPGDSGAYPYPGIRSSLYFAMRAKLGTQYVLTSPVVRVPPATMAGSIEDPGYDPIRAAVVAKGGAAGIALTLRGRGGDALADNVALVLSDAANLADVTPSNVATRVEWVGRETPDWDSALVELAAPGLPAFQAFIRGLAPGVADSHSPGPAQSFVRPVEPLARGHIPTTAAAFGGTPEFTTIGGGLFEHW